MKNVDTVTVEGFGQEWAQFDQSDLPEVERRRIFDSYFSIFPWNLIDESSVGADVGCGSGRWAVVMAPKVGVLHCVDPSDAIDVARANCGHRENVQFHRASVDDLPFATASLDFAYSLGVLHHVPDTQGALVSLARVLKKGAPFLVYLYYAFDNRPGWFRVLWGMTDRLRRAVSRMPFRLRYAVTQVIAALIYWPLATLARFLDRRNILPSHFPLAAYRDKSFYTMRTDALDRFGTVLEQRFSRQQIEAMLMAAGFTDIRFSDQVPFWCAVGIRN